MRSMNRGLRMLLWAGSLIVCLLTGATRGYAAEGQSAAPSAKATDDGGRGSAFLQDLGLSPEQMAKLREDRLQTRREIIRAEAEIKTLQVDLQEELSREQPNQANVDQIAKQLGAAETRRVKFRAGRVLFLRSILTPEQQQKLDLNLLQDDPPKGHRGGRRVSPARPAEDDGGPGPDGPQ